MTNNSSNSTTSQQHYRYLLFTVVYSIVFLLGLPLNAIAIWIFLKRIGLGTATVIYMFNLAISDLLFTISLPLKIYYFATASWPFGDFLCMVPGTLFSVNIYSSSFLITLICLDRYLAVLYPLRSRLYRRPRAAKVACVIVWCIILGISFPIGVTQKTTKSENGNTTHCFEKYPIEMWKYALSVLGTTTLIGGIFPFLVMIFCTLAVIKKLIITETKPNVDKQKIIGLFAINFALYAICFVPFQIALILYGIGKTNLSANAGNSFDAHIITMCLASCNSCLDPLLYYFTTENFSMKATRRVDRSSTTIHLQNYKKPARLILKSSTNESQG
uniref:Lysophosphatidic acid receptor 5a n=2 Tax=Latimeria chalumnae TaxID=7897 RepID=H3AAT2_LATCH